MEADLSLSRVQVESEGCLARVEEVALSRKYKPCRGFVILASSQEF
jgi:hypothetical protein